MQKYRNRLILGFTIAFVIYVGLLLLTNTGDLLAHLRAYPVMALLPVVALKVLSWGFRFGAWQYYLGVVGARDKLSVFDSLIIYVAGFALAVSPGKMGEVLKAVVVRVKTGVPVTRTVPVVIAERVVDGIAVLIVTFGAALLAGDALDLGAYRTLLFVSFGLLVAGLIAVQIAPLANFVLDIIARVPFVRRFHGALTALYASSREVFQLRHVIPTAILGALAYTADSVGFWLILGGFGLDLTWDLFLQATFIAGVTAALGALSGVPNGAGVTEISQSGMLLALVAPTNPVLIPSAAMAAAVIEGFFHKWLRVLVGLVVGVMFRRRLFSPEVDVTIAEMQTESP